MTDRWSDRAKKYRSPYLLVIVAFACQAVVAAPGGAVTTAQRLANLKAQIAATQRAADASTARYEQALTDDAKLQDQIAAARQSVRTLERRVGSMRSVVRERAVATYMAASGGGSQFSAIFGAKDALQAARSSILTTNANQHDNDIIDRFHVASVNLNRRVAQLAAAQRREQTIISESEAAAKRTNQELTALQSLRQRLERQQRGEDAARAATALRAARASQTRRQSTVPRTPTRTPDSPSSPPQATPVRGNNGVSVCPIRGPVSFVDTWHAPRPGGRLHEGVDLMSPHGTPDVAVTSGRVAHNSGLNEGIGLFLYGDNGTTYYYFHLSSYAGGERHVQTGEVIGYVGATGDTTANHTHFEIHPGGGGPINPYPAVRAVCG